MNSLQADDIKIVRGLPPVATTSDRVAVDTEFFGMEKERLHRPHGKFACATFTFDGETVYIVENEKDLAEAMKRVESAVHVFHNSKFDINQIRRFAVYPHRLNMWDTMLIEQIRYSGYYSAGEYALADLSRRYLHLYMDKTIREEFVTQEQMTPEMRLYSAIDCASTWRIFKAQLAEISASDLKIWKEIECPYLFALLTFTGFKLDIQAWQEATGRHRSHADEIQARYGGKTVKTGPRGGKKTVWTGINLASPEQVKKQVNKLLKNADLPRVLDTNEDTLQEYAEQVPFIKDLLEFRGHEKEATTYGEAILKYVEADGRIWPDIRQMGASTGRLSMQRPNGQNIPNTPERRACIVPDEKTDGILVDADYSSQEPRIFAYLCQDPTMKQIFKDRKDIYIEFARLGFGEIITKADVESRKEKKITVLGMIYGLTEYGMERKHNISLDRGKLLRAKFWDTFPEARTYRNWITQFGRDHEYVSTIMGRRFWLNTYQFGWENNCMNSPVQGTAADMIKVATVKFLDKWGWSDNVPYQCPIVNEAHDEILLEVPFMLVDAASNLLRDAMLETAAEMHPGIFPDVELKSGKNWAEVH